MTSTRDRINQERQAMLRRGISAFEDATGDRLPDADGEDYRIMGAIADAMGAPGIVRGPNSPIEALLAQYEAEGCDSTNMAWVQAAARRYVETMADSQVRYLLHILANAEIKSQPNKDGWTEWAGGARPVEDNVLVDVILRDGSSITREEAGWREWSWGRCGNPEHDIMLYRVSERDA